MVKGSQWYLASFKETEKETFNFLIKAVILKVYKLCGKKIKFSAQ